MKSGVIRGSFQLVQCFIILGLALIGKILSEETLTKTQHIGDIDLTEPMVLKIPENHNKTQDLNFTESTDIFGTVDETKASDIIGLKPLSLMQRSESADLSLKISNKVRPNVVEENPSLDVGPLVELTVAEGNTARLTCVHQPSKPEDSARLVLWYRNDTSRPFISYDARSKSFTSNASKGIQITGGGAASGITKPFDDRQRMYLEHEGASLVIRRAETTDQAEYRCLFHYSLSPSYTNRFKLVVADNIKDMALLDSEGRKIAGHVGPLPEDSHLSLTCKCKFDGELTSLEWLMDGRPMASSWTKTGSNEALSSLEITLKRDFANALLTCRMKTTHGEANKGPKSRIIDISTNILMFYVPAATLIIDSAGAEDLQRPGDPKGGAVYRVTEGMTVTFICAVKARPKPYNISWLHNGRIIGSGGRRWAKHNSSLVVSPVNKDDAGLYNCLASNREGDGQSNAINLRVAHSPFCNSPTKSQIIARRNSSVSLTCEVEAEPADVSFTWSYDTPKDTLRATSSYNNPNLQIYSPHSKSTKGLNSQKMVEMTKPSYKSDPDNSKRSYLIVPPGSSIEGIVCYAKNKIGRMRVPCAFEISYIDPPNVLEGCKVSVVSASELKVACNPEHHSLGKDNSGESSPGLSYVMSPEVKSSSTLEVWSENKLIRNLSNHRPYWIVTGLPHDTPFHLRLYSSSSSSKVAPIELYTRTQSKIDTNSSASKPANNEDKSKTTAQISPDSGHLGMLGLVGGLVGGVGTMACLLAVSIILIKRRARRRRLPIIAQMREVKICLPPVTEGVAERRISFEEINTETAT